MRRAQALALAVAALLCMGAAADPAEQLPEPAKEAHARAIFRQVRCLVCQNESIDDSEAPLAADLRRIIRGEIAAGRSDREIYRFLTDRYGEFVLFRPRFSPGNAVLWLTPFALLGAGGLAILAFRRRAGPSDAALSAEEQERLAALTHSPAGAATVPLDRGPADAPNASG